MTNDDIIRMAEEAGMPYNYRSGEINNLNPLERFAALVAAAEKLRCADLVTDMGNKGWDCYSAAAAIREGSHS